MKCQNCQEENPDTATFCNKCGAKLEAPQDQTPPPAEKKKRGKGKTLLIAVGAVIVLCIVVAIIAALSGGGDEGATPTPAQLGEVQQQTEPAPTETQPTATSPEATKPPTDTPPLTSTDTPSPTNTPTDTPMPTDTPIPTDTPTPTPEPTPIVLSGRGQSVTDEFIPPSSVSVASFTHDGSSNFIVEVYQGDDTEILINEIGRYSGSRPILGDDPTILAVDADGAWTVEIRPIWSTDTALFSGKGDAVSGAFVPPGNGAWDVSHDGKANFIVMLHCAGGSDIVQNEIGAVSGSIMVAFPEGPCLWEVQADGNWRLAPRE